MDVLTMMPDRAGEPSDKMDGAAAVGQFLREVSLVDLVVELVQNDLDAGASRTSIDFGEHGLSCEGDGAPLNAKAWVRLESVIAAGGDIEAKKDGIGSKNHGLRSLFLLADRIGVQSDGLRTDLTVRGNRARPRKFKPAFWLREPDPGAPAFGTRILAPYRQSPIKVPDGDNTTLQPLNAAALDGLWRTAVDEAPERFIAASRPGAPWRYTLRLSRHGLGTAILTFECAPAGPLSRRVWLRTCRVRRDSGSTRTVLRRHAVRFQCVIDDGGKIPRLFRAGGRVWGELNWRVDQAGRPLLDRGRLRYPIAFSGQEARSGHGFDIAAPFIAGRSRHDISADRRNMELVQQARDAFAAAGNLLARMYGTRSTAMIRGLEQRAMDAGPERQIVERMLDGGGLCSAVFDKNAVPSVAGRQVIPGGTAVILPVAADGRPHGLAMLAGLAAGSGAVLHPDTPHCVREHLEGLAKKSDLVQRFAEPDAARLVLLTQSKVDRPSSDAAAQRAAAALQALEVARRKGALPADLVDELKADGALPGFDGRFVAWRKARRLDRAPPIIPGVASPPVVHQEVVHSPVLSRGALFLKPFDLGDYLSALNFDVVGDPVRQRFFGWLARNASPLKAATLRKIAQKPVWPGVDGVHRPLAAYCHPRSRTLQRLLALGLVAPAPATLSLLGSRRLPAKSPRVRAEPTDQELLEWHAAALAAVKVEQSPEEGRRRLDALEKDLAWVLQRHPGVAVRMGSAHETLTQIGEMIAVSKLHIPSIAAAACGLPASALTRKGAAPLYERLGAYARPTAAAVLTALRDDPDPQKLFVRLEAYKRGSRNLSELASEKVIPVNGTVLAGDDCAFVGDSDFWGDWKVGLSGDGVADHHALLSQLGVTRARPTKDLAVAFFSWLSRQHRAVQQKHHAQVYRHWKEASGPPAWIASNQDIPCIPVTSVAKPFELVSLASAMHQSERIYLDDFPEVREKALADGKLRLTLIKAPGTRSTILDLVAGVGVRSLRGAFGPPRTVGGSGALELVGDLGLELSQLQTRKQLAELRSRLPLNGVAIADLRPEWQKMLKAISGVRSRPELRAVYRLHGQDFEVPVRSGIDRDSGFILVGSDSDKLHEMYEVLAEHLFKSGRSNAWGLMRAARDKRQLEFLATGMEEPEDDEEGEEDGDPKNTGGDVDKGHGLSAAKLKPVVPDPKPLPQITDPTRVPRERRSIPKARSQSQATQSLEEEDQKRALKREHYGYHCQACIGDMDVLKAAPPGTYVFAPGYRQRLIQAHHVQHRQNGGGVGAGNLVVLCEYHHRLWGDRMARGPVLAALANATPLKRAFPTDAAGDVLETQAGLLAKVPLSAEPFEARLFFTAEHAAAWKASQ
ncbi:MAG TPA: hypothetical protein ENH55_14095 [Aurantimonas coralicida]|uniref:Uncharacterized protein n=2 Tax=root TaxID=1 RepID=A0A9C9TFD7_9HYPH|nr:hypothetical protein [Aurantimonas coralicida]HET99219.1 hypothetical protein [Aurantimonas coralicida]